MRALVAKLGSGDPAQVQSALQALGARGNAEAVAALVAFVEVGQPDAWADRGIEALGRTHSEAARPLLTRLTRHRRARARVLAYHGLAQIPGAAQDALLAQGLRDSDPKVRGTCATLLGERGAKSTVEVLLRALERGVPEAAVAIGKLGDPAALARFNTLLERLPIAVMLSGYERFLARPDLPEADKLDIVARLGEVASVQVRQFLEHEIAAGVGAHSARLRHALVETARRIDPHPGLAPKPGARAR